MYFPSVYKRLHYIDCNQLFRYVFRQASTSPFFCTFSKKGTKWAVFKKKPAYNPSNRNLYPLPSAEADGRKKKIYLIFKGLTPTEEPAKPDIYSSVCWSRRQKTVLCILSILQHIGAPGSGTGSSLHHFPHY